MKIDKQLNLVCPIETDSGVVYIHSTPIGREVFEKYFLPLSKTFGAIFTEGLQVVAGPRVAAMLLKKVSIEDGVWDGPQGVSSGLMEEIRRLSNVAVPTDAGWATLPLYDALAKGHLEQRDVDEAENAIVFFTCISLMCKRSEAATFVTGMSEIWGTLTTSSNVTEYARSLPMLTETGTSSPEVKPSSIPA
ncbi:MAG: hypothetical protein JO253_02935 [Alphaproteobacteria bacterium]|nr:hypothetical protein [Alphaproteobacteria bacterium]